MAVIISVSLIHMVFCSMFPQAILEEKLQKENLFPPFLHLYKCWGAQMSPVAVGHCPLVPCAFLPG